MNISDNNKGFARNSRIGEIHGDLILGGITNQSLVVVRLSRSFATIFTGFVPPRTNAAETDESQH